MSNVEKRAFEFRADDEDEGKIVGHAAVFSEWYDLGWFEERIMPGAFADVLGDDVRFLFNHDPNLILGRSKSGTLLMQEDDTGLAVALTPPDTQLARDLRTLILRGDVSQMSFAFEVKEDSWEHGDEKDGQRDRRSIHKVKRLYDVSAVTYPASPNTDVAVRSYTQSKPQSVPQQRDMEQFKRRLKFKTRRYDNG